MLPRTCRRQTRGFCETRTSFSISLGDTQLRQIAADLAEDGDQVIRRRQEEELVGVARAALQQGRLRLAVGADLDRVDGNASRLDISTSERLPGIDRCFARRTP